MHFLHKASLCSAALSSMYDLDTTRLLFWCTYTCTNDTHTLVITDSGTRLQPNVRDSFTVITPCPFELQYTCTLPFYTDYLHIHYYTSSDWTGRLFLPRHIKLYFKFSSFCQTLACIILSTMCIMHRTSYMYFSVQVKEQELGFYVIWKSCMCDETQQILVSVSHKAAPSDDKLPTGYGGCVHEMSIGPQPTTWITINPKKEIMPSLGSWPLVWSGSQRRHDFFL